jgi:hypothetical protein
MAETLKNGATVLWKVKDVEGNAFWGTYCNGNRELAERRFKERLQLLYPPKKEASA